MYAAVSDHDGGHYTPNSHYQHQLTPSLTTSANILNYDPTSPHLHQATSPHHHQASEDHGVHSQDFQDVQYKREPSTPTACPTMSHSEYASYPTPFTPSPSLSGSESPRTPNSYYQPSSSYPTLEGGERLSVPYPAPTPPLSATHLAKESLHSIPDTEVKFSNEQIDCICDTLQQRKDMSTLGE